MVRLLCPAQTTGLPAGLSTTSVLPWWTEKIGERLLRQLGRHTSEILVVTFLKRSRVERTPGLLP